MKWITDSIFSYITCNYWGIKCHHFLLPAQTCTVLFSFSSESPLASLQCDPHSATCLESFEAKQDVRTGGSVHRPEEPRCSWGRANSKREERWVVWFRVKPPGLGKGVINIVWCHSPLHPRASHLSLCFWERHEIRKGLFPDFFELWKSKAELNFGKTSQNNINGGVKDAAHFMTECANLAFVDFRQWRADKF